MFKSFSQICEQAYLIDYGNSIDIETNKKVITHFKYIQNLNYKFVFNIVPSFNKLLIQFNPNYKINILNLLKDIKLNKFNVLNSRKKHNIEICYDEEYALDFKEIEKKSKLDFDSFIKLHLKTNFHVFMIGFLPGLPFLGTMNINNKIPRKLSPRLQVPSGSVGIVDNLCVIYPNDSPGGWNIIGKTKKRLFSLDKKNYSIISPGDQVQFKKISKDVFLTR